MIRSTEAPIIVVFNRLIAPAIAVGTLFLFANFYWSNFGRQYGLMAFLAFVLCSQVFAELNLLRYGRQNRLGIDVKKLLSGWMMVVGILLFLAYAFKASDIFSRRVLLSWIVTCPILIFFAQLAIRSLIVRRKFAGTERRAVIVGAGELGWEFAQRLSSDGTMALSIAGFFDDRQADRLPDNSRARLAGTLREVPEYIRSNKISNIYITLPMAAQPRTMQLLEELHDSTASIFFVPDVRRFNVVQTRLHEISDMPVIGVSDTPFKGTTYLAKRAFDISAALGALTLLGPILLAIAFAVRLSSPGPVIFRQRRYGLDGEEIVVYKFRSMTVCEDGGLIEQAKKQDMRVTPLGRILRKTSLDELPQLINVLQGRMSIVGPRPHAVAHNEMYRKLIRGYMLRHKVKPGITGWAQVNGYRGETETIDKMEARVSYDMYYIRNWSLFLDFMIIARTIALVYRDPAAH